jgi:hypothetical protein
MDAAPAFEEPCGHTLTLVTVLARVRAELTDLGRCADGLQDTISAIVPLSTGGLTPSMLMRLQTADALSQRLDRLAQLARALEASIPDLWALDMRSDGELVRALLRLVGPDGHVAGRITEEDGDCEIF